MLLLSLFLLLLLSLLHGQSSRTKIANPLSGVSTGTRRTVARTLTGDRSRPADRGNRVGEARDGERRERKGARGGERGRGKERRRRGKARRRRVRGNGRGGEGGERDEKEGKERRKILESTGRFQRSRIERSRRRRQYPERSWANAQRWPRVRDYYDLSIR